MWRSQLGSKEVKTITQADDDDWETDPDFVVSHVSFSLIFSVLLLQVAFMDRIYKKGFMNKLQWVCKICNKTDTV